MTILNMIFGWGLINFKKAYFKNEEYSQNYGSYGIGCSI